MHLGKCITFRGGRVFLGLGFLLSSLSSCSSNMPAKSTYELGIPYLLTSKIISKQPVQVIISYPTALRILDSDNILIKGGSGSIAFLENSHWSDRLPELIQERLIQVFENTRSLNGVGRQGQGINVDYRLLVDIRSFEVLLTPSDKRIANVALSVKILNDKTGNLIGSEIFHGQEIFVPYHTIFYVNALNNSFKAVARQIVAWTLKEIAHEQNKQ